MVDILWDRCNRTLNQTQADIQETVDMVRRAFPTLAKYPAGRIAFEVSDLAPASTQITPQQYPPPRSEWAKVMDEAWPQFKRKPPSRIRVTVIDAPGDDQRRKLYIGGHGANEIGRTRNWQRSAALIAAVTIGPVVVFGLIVLLAYSLGAADDE